VDLWHTAQRIGVLDPAAVDMALHDSAVTQETPQPLRHQQAAVVRAQAMEAFVKRSLGTRQGFQAHGADDVRGFQAVVKPLYGLYGKSKNELGAIDQRQPFLGAQRDGSKAILVQDFPGRFSRAPVKDFTKSDEREKEMRQRGQVAGGAYRAFFRHYGYDVFAQHPEDTLQRRQLYPGITLRKRMHLGDKHDPGYLFRNGVAYPDAMTLEDLVLQDLCVFLGYFCIGENTKTGIDPVDGSIMTNDVGYMLLTGPYPFDGGGRQYAFHGARGQFDGSGDRQLIETILKIGRKHISELGAEGICLFIITFVQMPPLPARLLFFLQFFVFPAFSQVTASFNTVSSTCLNTPVTIQNTSANATNYYWSFCAADFNSTPEAVNLGNPNGVFSAASPVFGCYAQDGNGNFYGLVSCYDPGHLVRLNFGNSLLNTPTAEDLGNLGGVIPNQSEGIQLLNVNNDWIAILVGGAGNEANSSPRVVKIDFGSSLANSPTATNWGTIGGLNLPHDLFITKEGNRYYGFAVNVQGNTLTRLDFGTDFTATPTGVNMGNIGNLNYPSGMAFVNYNSSWYCYIANQNANSLTRLNFGNSLLNTPLADNISNPGGYFDAPRDVSIFVTCDGIYGFVSNYLSNEIVKLNFGTDPMATPAATDLGNIGNLSFPHSISDFFRVGNDIYAFIPNATGRTLTRIRFAGCSDIPGTSVKDPAPVSYSKPGIYNINLLVDLGLPTQTSYCQQVTINALPQGGLTGDTVCYGNEPVLLFAGKGAAPFDISYSDGANTYVVKGLHTQSTIPLPYPLTAPDARSFVLQTISDANGCASSVNTGTNVLLAPLPQGGISGASSVCGADSAIVSFNPSNGTAPFEVQLSNGNRFFTASNVGDPTSFQLPFSSSPTTFSLISLTDKYGCVRTSGFDKGTFSAVQLPAPKIIFKPLDPVCISEKPIALVAAAESTGLSGSGAYSGAGTDVNGVFSSSVAGVGRHKIQYTFAADNGCSDTASGIITVNPLPVVSVPSLITICGGVPVQVAVKSNGVSYAWSPAAYVNNPGVADPVITVDSTTTLFVQVTDSNACTTDDSLVLKVSATANTAFMVPNAFTPNGDGHNDCFGIQHWGDVSLEQFSVYDRLGTCVFSTTDPSVCWDGRFRGRPLPGNGYVYLIRAKTACGLITRKGTLLLVR
jgi:gliding motility-associated-like protein